MGKNLVYTVALDTAGTTAHRNMAKMLASSLLRTRFSGDIIVFHNSAHRIFGIAREGVREVRIDLPEGCESDFDVLKHACFARYLAGRQIEVAQYEKIMFLDVDSVALRNIDPLFAGDEDLAVYPEPGTQISQPWYGCYLTDEQLAGGSREGLNSGSWIIRAAHFRDFVEQCLAIGERPRLRDGLPEQGAFNRAVLDWQGTTRAMGLHEVALPMVTPGAAAFGTYRSAAIVHAAGGQSVEEKLQFLFGVFSVAFLFDPQLALLNILEM